MGRISVYRIRCWQHVWIVEWCETDSRTAGAVRRSQIMNHVLKSGGLVGNALGTVAVSYSVMHCLLAYVPAIEDNDEAKSIISGTATGLFFKSTSGLQKCARGGLIGLGVSTLWALGLKKQETIQHYI